MPACATTPITSATIPRSSVGSSAPNPWVHLAELVRAASHTGTDWNFTAAHCYGVPEILDEEANLRTLATLVEHSERHVQEPMLFDAEWGAQLAKGTVGIRLPIARFQCKVEMSQDKDPVSRRQVIAALRASGSYRHPRLADAMERALTGD
jgi:transcriptional regulator